MISDNIKDILRNMMRTGYITVPENGKNVTYGISKENISVDFFEDDTNMNQEMLERLIERFEQDGIKWRFETNDGWRAKGYKDPTADLLIDTDLANILCKRGPAPDPKRRKPRGYSNR